MSNTEKTISKLIESQLPDFINAKYAENAPSFRRFLELYYIWLEENSTTGISSAAGNTIYHIMNSEKYRDIDETEEAFLTYFKNELLPFFPEKTELELVKILKGAKEFYSKKGTEQSIEWLFRVLFNKEANIFYPRDNILKASDGKWQLPKSLKVSETPFLIQYTSSSKNYYAPNPASSLFHSGNTFLTTVEFDNTFRKTSTILAFTSYKIWANTAATPSILKSNLVSYIATNESSSIVDSANNTFIPLLSAPLISNNFSGYGTNNVCFQVVEAFYNESIVNDATTLTFNNALTPQSIASIFGFGSDPSKVKIQFDGIEAYEIGNLQKNSLIAANSTYVYAKTTSNTKITVDSANTPYFAFSFAKEETGNALNADSVNNIVIANTTFGDDRYVFQYTQKYIGTTVNSVFTSATSANIAAISFAFKQKDDTNLSSLERKYVIGETSGARAVVEKVFHRVDEYTKTRYTEIFISNVEGSFVNNELVTIEADDGVFSERILGSVEAVTINPNYTGLRYKIGDPAVIYGGFVSENGETSSAGFKYATAIVSDTTKGIIKSISLLKGGYGYRAHPNTQITVVNGPSDTTGSGAVVQVNGVDTTSGITLSLGTDTISPYANSNIAATSTSSVAIGSGAKTFTIQTGLENGIMGVGTGNNVTVIRTDNTAQVMSGSITSYNNTSGQLVTSISTTVGSGTYTNWIVCLKFKNGSYFPNNTVANANSTLTSCFSFQNFTFYPISSLSLISQGQGYSTAPTLSYNTVYQIDGTTNVAISSLGYIANVEVVSGGSGYSNGDILLFNGANGPATGYVNVASASPGPIVKTTLTSRGYGYTVMPAVTVSSAGGVGATLKAYGFNDGAEASLTVDEVGSITELSMTNLGFGYIAKPNVSLKVMDIYVSNLSFSFSPDQSLTIYQGSSLSTATFTANVDISYISEINQSGSSNAIIRVYDYNGTLETPSESSYIVINETSQRLKTNLGSYIYGNGYAKANLVFVDGTLTYPGYFLNTDGFLSADKKLQDKNKYHNFSYILESEKQYKDYRETLHNIVHPIGTELLAYNRISDIFDNRNIISHQNTITYYTTSICSIYGGYAYFNNYYSGNTKLLNLGNPNSNKIVGLGGDQYWSNVRLLVPFDSSITTDISSYAATGTAFGSPVVNNTIYSVGTGSGDFVYNGTDRYVSFGPSANYRIPASGTDFTVEGWIYIRQFPVTPDYRLIALKYNGTVGQSMWIRLNGSSGPFASNGISCYLQGGSESLLYKDNLSTNTWYHFAAARNSGNTRLFINGVQSGTTDTTALTPDSANPTWNIGAGGGFGFAAGAYCFVDDFRYTVGTGRYTTNFSPPVIAYANSESNSVCGNLANIIANDTIVINSETTDRTIVRTVANSTITTLNTTAPIFVFGYGLLTLNNTSYAVSTVNVANKIIANDSLRIFLSNGDVIIKTVYSNPNSAVIQLNSSPGISATGLGYIIDPYIANSTIKVIREI
jgi:hypothetical protein